MALDDFEASGKPLSGVFDIFFLFFNFLLLEQKPALLNLLKSDL